MIDPGKLFGDLPEQRSEREKAAGAPRLRTAQRDQRELRSMELDELLGSDHPARAVWAFVEALDLREILDGIKARDGSPGHPPADPKILMTLWLYATIDGVGSARALSRLCESDAAYRWICGGVSMNYHTLSSFRVSQEALLDRLLAKGVAALVDAGLVTLQQLAQDGVRVRAAAGTRSYRRRGRLEDLLGDAQRRVGKLKAELATDPAASTARRQAAQERAARERVERTAAALNKLKELEERRARREKTHKMVTEKQKERRASTTDPDAEIMKMANGGFQPAYNVQLASDPDSQVIVSMDVATTGSDVGLMGPMLDRIRKTYDTAPQRHLVDGGYTKIDDIEQSHAAGIQIFSPLLKNKHKTDPAAPRRSDGPGTAAWRERMASDAGKAIYRLRCKAECIHAHLRNRMGYRLMVRGRQKVRTVLLWFAVAHNLMRAIALGVSSSGLARA